ncbi:MAG: TonB-dependent receptor [Chromatiales bacterium]|nr:TonB-dependent receptor [Chromatiales bacterium]
MTIRLAVVPGGALIALAALAEAGAGPGAEEIIVTAQRRAQPALTLIGNATRIDQQAIGMTGPRHPFEIGIQAPGTWISRGTQQEHLTAIRSPVLTGPGACGSFLMLEDGIPIRPVGFCNVNQLFEVPVDQARAIEVLRGPANALYGANGLHGTLNFLLPVPGSSPGLTLTGELGPYGYRRGRVLADGDLAGRPAIGGLTVERDGDFRDDAGYNQWRGFLRWQQALPRGAVEVTASGSWLDQETAGFITGLDAYRDRERRRANPNPESFRKADSQRLALRWLPPPGDSLSGLDLRLYLRRSEMDFLQHFLPGQPREENGQLSGGVLLGWQAPWRDGSLSTGLDIEIASGWLRQVQAQPITEGSDFLRETRPAGRHYDFEVTSWLAAPYAQIELPLSPRWILQAGLRLEYLLYDYDNQMLDGNTRDDGTPCGFGGCLYNRPADRRDSFIEVAPNIGLLWRIDARTSGWVSLTRGFRPPQATELYRLQSGQRVADLDSESLDSLELGLRHQAERLRLEAVAFAMDKRDYILRDAEGFNVSDGRSRHHGIELSGNWLLPGGLYAAAAGTWARQVYRFDRAAGQGEVITRGNDIDTAPRTLGSVRLGHAGASHQAELEWVHIGGYYLDAANTARYPGHDLLNLRLAVDLNRQLRLVTRINNLTDRLVADRADLAFGQFRYFPGREREILVELSWRLPPHNL